MHVEDFIANINDQIESYIAENFKEVTAKDCGLDPRAGYLLFINDECMVCHIDGSRTLDYYGGFEYVDTEFRTNLGNYVFFNNEDGRVFDCIRYFLGDRNN